MFEKLLQRIAGRGRDSQAGLQAKPEDQPPEAALISSASAHDPFSTSYPASLRIRSASIGLSAPGLDNPWLLACDNYARRREQGGRIADQPAYFADWGVAHMAVAQLLWAEHDRLHEGVVTIHCNDALLAVLYPEQRRVSLNEQAFVSQVPLTFHQLPAKQRAKMAAGRGFTDFSLYGLLWFYGQVNSYAPDLLPHEFGSKLIQMRRFPQVEPAALDIRHLALIHVFSGGALSFAQLQSQMNPEFKESLCADLTSMYFTGALRLLPK